MPTDRSAAKREPSNGRRSGVTCSFRRCFRRGAVTLGSLFLLLLLVYAFEFARFNFTEPTIARDYAAEHDFEIEKIPEEDRAWPVYREAMLRLHPLSLEAARALARLPEQYDHPDVVAYLADNQALLDLFREAASRAVVGFPWTQPIDEELSVALELPATPSEGPVQFRLPSRHLGAMQRGAQLLSADMRIAVDEGDGARAAGNITALLGMATHTWLRPRLQETLFSVSSFAGAARQIGEALHKRPEIFSDAELATFADRFLEAEFDFLPLLETERIFFLDAAQRAFSDDGQGDGLLIGAEEETSPVSSYRRGGLEVWINRFFGPVRRHLIASRKEHVELYEELLGELKEQASLPLSEQLRLERDPVLDRLKQLAYERKHPFILASFPPGLRVLKFEGRLHTERDAIIAAIALERFRRERGSYPKSLAELAPAFLDEIPVDRFDDKPLRYEIRNGRPFLYSVGTDQDDDGGAPARDGSGEIALHPQSRPTDGDWIIYPPDSLLNPEDSR